MKTLVHFSGIDFTNANDSKRIGLIYMTDIIPTCTSSMQELIKQGMGPKLEKSCFRYKKNTWHVESNYILQPP